MNDALKPVKLERHLKTVRPNICDHAPEFFESKLINLKKIKLGLITTRYALSEKTLAASASFEIPKLIAKLKKKRHTICESLMKLCMLKTAEEVLEVEA